GALGALSLDRERRPDLLRVRLGIAPVRDRVPRDLPRPRERDTVLPAHRAAQMAPLSGRVRRGADQDARRSLLARPHLPLLPPRDAAHAKSAELVFPSPAQAASPRGGARQPLRTARRTVVPVLSAADRDTRRDRHHRHAGVAAPLRQLLVAQRDHDRARYLRFRRRGASPSDPVRTRRPRASGALPRARADRHGAHPAAQLPPGAEPGVTPPADEL